jgi:hypothetical protein
VVDGASAAESGDAAGKREADRWLTDTRTGSRQRDYLTSLSSQLRSSKLDSLRDVETLEPAHGFVGRF